MHRARIALIAVLENVALGEPNAYEQIRKRLQRCARRTASYA